MVPVRISVSMLKENMNKYNRKVLEQGLYLEFVKGGGACFFLQGAQHPLGSMNTPWRPEILLIMGGPRPNNYTKSYYFTVPEREFCSERTKCIEKIRQFGCI